MLSVSVAKGSKQQTVITAIIEKDGEMSENKRHEAFTKLNRSARCLLLDLTPSLSLFLCIDRSV